LAAEQGLTRAQNVVGDYYEKGLAPTTPRDIEKAVHWYKLAAVKEDHFAMYKMFCYFVDDGFGLTPDVSNAYKYLRASADLGYDRAQYELGGILEDGGEAGHGLDRNQKTAFEWYLKAAEQGYSDAMLDVGHYLRGDHGQNTGVTINNREAFQWFQKAVDSGEEGHGCFELAQCYVSGAGVEMDLDEAFKWFEEGAQFGDPRCCVKLATFYREGLGKVSQDLEKSLLLVTEASNQGYPHGHMALGIAHEDGIGTPVDFVKAAHFYRLAAEGGIVGAAQLLATLELKTGFENRVIPETEKVRWLRVAAESGVASSQVELGRYYESGEVVGVDYAEAAQWYRLAAEQGDPDGQQCYGTCLKTGLGVAIDFNEAVRFYQLAVAQDHATALSELGVCYEEGKGVPQSLPEAVALYRRGAALEGVHATYNLARVLLFGIGVQKDPTEAVRLLEVAEAAGYEDAARLLKVWRQQQILEGFLNNGSVN
jgi:TPR repeat protein